MYKTIVNPSSGRRVSITGKLGRSIVQNYVNLLKGGAAVALAHLQGSTYNMKTIEEFIDQHIGDGGIVNNINDFIRNIRGLNNNLRNHLLQIVPVANEIIVPYTYESDDGVSTLYGIRFVKEGNDWVFENHLLEL